MLPRFTNVMSDLLCISTCSVGLMLLFVADESERTSSNQSRLKYSQCESKIGSMNLKDECTLLVS